MRSKLNILFIVDEFYSASTPFILNQVTGMIDRGHYIFILARGTGRVKDPHSAIAKYGLDKKYFVLDKINNDKYSRIGYFLKYAFRSFFHSPKFFFRSLNFFKYGRYAFSLRLFHEVNSLHAMKRKEFDIIHAQFGPLGQMAAYLKDIKMIKGVLVTQFRGYDVSKLIVFEGKNNYNFLFKHGEYFLANCRYFYDKIILLGAPPERSFVQYSGVITSKFLNNEKKAFITGDVLQLGTVARLSGKKGIEYILQALKLLKEKGVKFNYQIIGDGELKGKIIQLIDEYDLKNEVSLLGTRDHDYIQSFLKTIAIFISHNVKAENGDEDAPVNTLKEAMLSGCVVISTFHGGIPELVKDKVNGFLVEEKDYIQLSRTIEEVASKKHDLSKIISAAKKTVIENFDNESLNDQLESKYLQFIQKSK